MNFNAALNLRTESAGQRGVVVLEFLPEQGLNAGKLTMTVSPSVAAELEVGATYRFDATKVEAEEAPAPEPESEGGEA